MGGWESWSSEGVFPRKVRFLPWRASQKPFDALMRTTWFFSSKFTTFSGPAPSQPPSSQGMELTWNSLGAVKLQRFARLHLTVTALTRAPQGQCDPGAGHQTSEKGGWGEHERCSPLGTAPPTPGDTLRGQNLSQTLPACREG